MAVGRDTGVICIIGCGKQKAPMVDVAANYCQIMERVKEAAAKVGRDPREVKVLGAAKSQSVGSIRAAIAAGVSLIGENYVQETVRKKKNVSEPVEWHMIGHLQRNKANAAVEIFDVIESLDSLALAEELENAGKKRAKKVRVFVEVNVAGETSKTGIDGENLAELLHRVGELTHISVEGLMLVPPLRQNAEEVRPYFRELRELQLELRPLGIPNVAIGELSMGMTHDFPVAIEEGATIVRIGTGLFGPRPT
jgi:pyridoxal phosphate enzyme (YggS family)